VRPFVKLQIARHNAGAQKQEESGEASNENENDNNANEMGDPGIRTWRDHVPGRMRKETRSAAPSAPTATHGSHGLAVGEPEYYQQGSIDNADLADHERNRRQH